MQKKLTQLKANKSPFLQSYQHTMNPDTFRPQCPPWLTRMTQITNCNQVPTQHYATGLWKKPLEAAEVIQEWETRLASFERLDAIISKAFLRG